MRNEGKYILFKKAQIHGKLDKRVEIKEVGR